MSAVALLRRRLAGTYEVDEWGYDRDVAAVIDGVLRVSWPILMSGAERVPDRGPAVLVVNRRLGWVPPLVLAAAVRRHTGRHLRFQGVPDIEPWGPTLRRLGGVLDGPDELRALLSAGHVCAMSLGPGWPRGLRTGGLRAELLAPALEIGAPVLPTVIAGGPLRGGWRVRVAAPVRGRDPGDLALAAVRGVERLRRSPLHTSEHPM